jgi:aminoglycoside 3-N-acetyltransferase I
MSILPDYRIQHLSPDDAPLAEALMTVFGDAFADAETYCARRPGSAYVRRLLASDSFIALVAREETEVVGGLVAYELRKLEQERSEIYIYDLAVGAAHRRQGIATALIRALQQIGAERGAYVIFVQADPPDGAAIALYSKLGLRENVLHFDIPVRSS